MKSSKYISKYTELSVNTIRVLGVEAISKANSGHPGIVLGAAPIMYSLFRNHLNVNPKNPNFFNRDRFVLSAGHGSALLYATMLVSGFSSISMDDLKNFRKLDSKTAGHPENILLPGVEVSTGPLGQGVAMAVGLAIAEKKLANRFNAYTNLIDHYTYCLFGDGCMEEGIFYEAISIAGKLNLNKLIMLYDSNKIQLDGKVEDSTKTNVKKLFKSVGWNYIKVSDANDVNGVSSAIAKAKRSRKPTVIECCSVIGYGCRLQNTNKCHGAPLTPEQVNELRSNLKYKVPPFTIHNNVLSDFSILEKRGKKFQKEFNLNINIIENKNLSLYKEFFDLIQNTYNFSIEWYKNNQHIDKGATRNIFGDVLQTYLENNPTMLTLNADLSGSTKVTYKKSLAVNKDFFDAQNINLGVRELAMEAIGNGICAHVGCRAIGSTFMSFSDYCKPALRVGAISHLPMVTVYSHDSITVGEDGPTHQPIEQLQSLRAVPNHYVIRPANYDECVAALYLINQNKTRPISVITSRGDFKQYQGSFVDALKGGYIIKENKKHDINIIATGSEVAVAFDVCERLAKKSIKAQIISMPCLELFNEQSEKYIDSVLGNKPIVSIEYGTTAAWYKIADYAVGIDQFGKSGKPDDVVNYFKLDGKQISDKIIKWYSNKNKKRR